MVRSRTASRTRLGNTSRGIHGITSRAIRGTSRLASPVRVATITARGVTIMAVAGVGVAAQARTVAADVDCTHAPAAALGVAVRGASASGR